MMMFVDDCDARRRIGRMKCRDHYLKDVFLEKLLLVWKKAGMGQMRPCCKNYQIFHKKAFLKTGFLSSYFNFAYVLVTNIH